MKKNLKTTSLILKKVTLKDLVVKGGGDDTGSGTCPGGTKKCPIIVNIPNTKTKPSSGAPKGCTTSYKDC